MVTEVLTRDRTISNLSEIVEGLPEVSRTDFSKMFRVSTRTGKLQEGNFPLGELARQTIIRVRNPWDQQSATFNSERAKRLPEPKDMTPLIKKVNEMEKKDAFCNLEDETPLNSFGRIHGESCDTCGSLYLSGEYHGILVSRTHSPLIFPSKPQFMDRFNVVERFAEAAHSESEDARHLTYIENRLKKGGATMWFHDHGQILVDSDFHEGKMEKMFDVYHYYRERTGRDYFEDLIRAYQAIGLGVERGDAYAFPSLTPVKEKEIVVLAYNFGDKTREFVYDIYRYFVEDLGIKALNFCVAHPPLTPNGRNWWGVPWIVSWVDRGDPMDEGSDMGALEVQQDTKIISSDPLKMNKTLLRAVA